MTQRRINYVAKLFLTSFIITFTVCFPGFEEEKLLGSILLPSYKISPCSSDDKVFRKFSFKAEHANMRTYYFAADTRESMIQWMNALSLASILQSNTKWVAIWFEKENKGTHFGWFFGFLIFRWNFNLNWDNLCLCINEIKSSAVI